MVLYDELKRLDKKGYFRIHSDSTIPSIFDSNKELAQEVALKLNLVQEENSLLLIEYISKRNPILKNKLQRRKTLSESLQELEEGKRMWGKFIQRSSDAIHNEQVTYMAELINNCDSLKNEKFGVLKNPLNYTIIGSLGSFYLTQEIGENSNPLMGPLLELFPFLLGISASATIIRNESEDQIKRTSQCYYLDHRIDELFQSDSSETSLGGTKG